MREPVGPRWRVFATGALALLGLTLTPAAALAEPAPADTAAFTLFGWLSPPADSTTEARLAQMADLSFNLALPAWLDQGQLADNLTRLDFAGAHGIRCLIWDDRFNGAWHWLPTFEDTLDQVVADYRDHPAFWGYYLGDEPPASEWPLLHRLRESLRQRDPIHPAWNNLSGRVIYPTGVSFADTVTSYAELVHPAVLCADHYDFTVTGDRGQFVENAAILRSVADAHGLPFWAIIQLIPHSSYRPLTLGEVSWQVSQLLAYGARGIGYFTYWPPDPDPAFNWGTAIMGGDGQPSPWYDRLRRFNEGVRQAGVILASSRWRRTTHSGSVPMGGLPFTPDDWIVNVSGRAAIGEFEGPGGEKYVLVANSDSLTGRTIALGLNGYRATIVDRGQNVFYPNAAAPATADASSLSLGAGEFALVSLEPIAAGTAAMAVAPNPGSGMMSFSIQVTSPNARFEILDTSGRRIWSQAVAAGPASVVWRGERDRGGTATAGIYFVRVAGAGQESVRRFAWLGTR
ncbi:MAG TPA: T9SS type A sorting domain-containing protein [Candidatus Sulfotelmatobacter sp.]|nr:T9SS type A sorting domain-containing protein [Candidatus Sulfotelmatobacter sp.]